MKNKVVNKPRHIGIILDGNGRWAKKRNLPRIAGHKEGVFAVERMIKAAREEGIEVVSVYAFSTENWKRSRDEVDGIFALIDDAIDRNKDKLNENNIKLQIMGDKSRLSESLQDKINNLIELTKNNTGLIFNIGLNYGGRDEILRATNICHEKYPNQEITKEMFEAELYTAGLPNLDFVIRTSGEMRLSNFMLYQAAYAEFYFPKTYWPDFNKRFLKKALKVYSKRNRRFGKVWNYFVIK